MDVMKGFFGGTCTECLPEWHTWIKLSLPVLHFPKEDMNEKLVYGYVHFDYSDTLK